MPEGDTLHRAARQLQTIVGEQVAVETPHPRASSQRIAETLDGRRLESVEAIGKNLLFRFEGGIVLRSHLRMSGRWVVRPLGRAVAGRPWLVLRGSDHEAVLWNGPVLELHARALANLGPDILATPPDFDGMVQRIRRVDRARFLGEALQDQSLVAGIGNMWLAETLWHAELSPWVSLRDVSDPDLRRALETAATAMRSAVDTGRPPSKQAYGRAGRPCRRCGTVIKARGQGDNNRTTFWCPACQATPG